MVGVIQSHFYSTHLISVTPSVIKIPSSMLIIGSYTQCNSTPSHSTLMLGCTCIIHRGYKGQGSDAPKLMLNINLEFSRAYSQHFQSYNSCAPNLTLNTRFHNSCVPEITLNIKYHHSCASRFMPNTLQNSIMYSSFCTFNHNNHFSICIKVNHIIHRVHRTMPIIVFHQGPFPTYTIAYMINKTYALDYAQYI